MPPLPYHGVMQRFLILAAALAVLLAVVLYQRAPAQAYLGSAPAREFPAGLDWINTDTPLSLADLEGKIVLLDFWTYGCINCIHVIPDLHALEQKYADELVVIGVHSAKFTNESETQNIRLIAERYDRNHPIVNDRDFAMWRSYNIAAWPSFVLIDPEGRVLGRHSGEGIYDLFDQVITGMIDTFAERGTLDRTPLDFNRNAVVTPRAALRFPGQILADAAGQRLFVADSSNHRIVITDFSGMVLDVIGSGTAGLRDGNFETAGFQRPQGMTLADANSLYVADTGNHSIRLVDLAAHSVTTIAGTGKQEYLFGRNRVDASSGLNSPWDVLWLDGQLFIAMAGQHQLWRYDPQGDSVWQHAGSGREELRDGPAAQAGLNQPSGLATDGSVLYVADSEASAVRQVDVEPDGQVGTLVGMGLFEFGDVDGTGDQVRLQHPKAVAFADGLIYVADTYNNRIKLLDPVTRVSHTLFGTGEAGWRDGLEAQFHEPGGLSIAERQLFVADTNNHAIRVADLDTLEVSTLQLRDPGGLLQRRAAEAVQFDEVIELPVVQAAAGDGMVRVALSLPAGYSANHLAPLQVGWSSSGAVVIPEPAASLAAPEYPLTLEFPVQFSEGSSLLRGEVTIYYCRTVASELCLIRQAQLRVPVAVNASGAAVVDVAWQPPALPAGY
jgi:thiol-disulfide isomerase/thioredoxin